MTISVITETPDAVTTNNGMSLDDWVAATKAQLDRFAAVYRDRSRAAETCDDPWEWPMAQPDSEWFDQFGMFRDCE